MKSTVLVSLVTLLVLFTGGTLGIQSIGNTLTVGTGGSTIITVVGCKERFRCEGEGTGITWRFFGTRVDVTNSSSRTITTSTSGDTVTSHLVFSPVMVEHENLYVCIIMNSRTRRTFTLSARLTVNKTRVYIEPIPNIDISNNTVGDIISFGCSIQTCEEMINVEILKGTQLLHTMRYEQENLVLINQDVTVSADTVDAYACRVLLSDGSTFMQQFNVTGTPISPPTTNPTTSGSNSGATPTTRNGATASHQQIQLLLLFCLLCLSSFFTTVSML